MHQLHTWAEGRHNLCFKINQSYPVLSPEVSHSSTEAGGTLEPAQTGLIPAPAPSQVLSVQDLFIVLPGRAESGSSDLAKNPNFSSKGTQENPLGGLDLRSRMDKGLAQSSRIAGSCTSSEATGFDHIQCEELFTDISLKLPSLNLVSLVSCPFTAHLWEESGCIFSLVPRCPFCERQNCFPLKQYFHHSKVICLLQIVG